MPLVERYANMIVEEHSEGDRNKFYRMLFVLILIKLFLLFVVYKFLWPNVMPKVFPGCASNPTFIQVIGLMVIAGVLM